jgi:hypothetical protein
MYYGLAHAVCAAAAAAGMWHRMPDGDFMGFSGEAEITCCLLLVITRDHHICM